MNDQQIRFVQTSKGLERMTEWNTPIFYYANDEINRRKTIKALAKFYSRQCVMLMAYKLKRNIHAKVSSRLHQATN